MKGNFVFFFSVFLVKTSICGNVCLIRLAKMGNGFPLRLQLSFIYGVFLTALWMSIVGKAYCSRLPGDYSMSLFEFSLRAVVNPNERFLAYSNNFLRLTNNMFQVKSMIAAAARTNRSVLVLDLAGRPPDHLLDLSAMQAFAYPGKVLYLPALTSRKWRDNLRSMGIEQPSPNKYLVSKCYTFNGYKNFKSGLWRFRGPSTDLGDWATLESHLALSTERIVVLCDMASFYSIFTDKPVAHIPYHGRLQDASWNLFVALPSFSVPKMGFELPGRLKSSHGKNVIQKISPQKEGGPEGLSLGIHYRRTDMTSLGVNVSTLLDIIFQFVQDLSVRRIFIATDADAKEVHELRTNLPPEVVISCSNNHSTLCLLPEEQLLIEEGVCMFTDYFLGSPGSSVSIIIHQMRTNVFQQFPTTTVLTNPEPYMGGLWLPELGDWHWDVKRLYAFARALSPSA